MNQKNLITSIIFIFILTACATGNDPSNNQDSSLITPNQCSNKPVLTVNKKLATITVPTPKFNGMRNPGMEASPEQFSMGILTEQVGLFEFQNFAVANLKAGTFTGKDFDLVLVNSPYKEGICSSDRYKNASRFIIENYDANSGQLKACLYAKFNCDAKIIEVNIPIAGKVLQ
ncbi:MAG: hypothetical protein KAH84_00245 [Thiomargarita sp.]|nr:hypothetical protein [Thiomargarita sp.]